MCWGIFYSAQGGENFVYNNEITVHKVEPSSKVRTAALYVCGGLNYFGGQFYNNRITTNVPAAWIATWYGGASNSTFLKNTIIPLDSTKFPTFQIGSEAIEEGIAQNIKFRSNEIEGGKLEIETTDQDHSYSVFWTLTVNLTDNDGKPVRNAEVRILNKEGKEVLAQKTNDAGFVSAELMEYNYRNYKKTFASPYKVVIQNDSKTIDLNKNIELNVH